MCLSHIINNIFEQCKILQKWKHERGLKDSVSNYRPISVLSFMDKLLERVIKDSLMIHLEAQKQKTEEVTKLQYHNNDQKTSRPYTK